MIFCVNHLPKIKLDISYELSARQLIHMKYHALFSLKKI